MLKYKFALPIPVLDSTEKLITKIRTPPAQLLCIINLDKMLISLDSLIGRTGERPSIILTIGDLKRSSAATNKCSRSATVIAGSNAADKVIPVTLVLQSEAEDKYENTRELLQKLANYFW